MLYPMQKCKRNKIKQYIIKNGQLVSNLSSVKFCKILIKNIHLLI